MEKPICMIGHFGGEESFHDGQTVKTHALAAAISSCAPDIPLYKADTYDCRKHKLRFLARFAVGLATSERIVLCVSKKGRRIFFPILYFAAKYFHKRVFHCAIGGRLADEAAADRRVRKYISSFEKNWVESRSLEENLRKQGVENAEYMPNFKDLPELSGHDLPGTSDGPLRCVIFSRVCLEKGIADAIASILQINGGTEQPLALLDIYGAVEPGFGQELEKEIVRSAPAVRYCGVVEANQSVAVLQDYDVLLFPTRYEREGIPGTIIDALAAGVPVIARRWRYCDEMLTHGVTGYCYDFDQPQMLLYWLKYALNHREDLAHMRTDCLKAARPYLQRYAAPKLVAQLRSGAWDKDR